MPPIVHARAFEFGRELRDPLSRHAETGAPAVACLTARVGKAFTRRGQLVCQRGTPVALFLEVFNVDESCPATREFERMGCPRVGMGPRAVDRVDGGRSAAL